MELFNLSFTVFFDTVRAVCLCTFCILFSVLQRQLSVKPHVIRYTVNWSFLLAICLALLRYATVRTEYTHSLIRPAVCASPCHSCVCDFVITLSKGKTICPPLAALRHRVLVQLFRAYRTALSNQTQRLLSDKSERASSQIGVTSVHSLWRVSGRRLVGAATFFFFFCLC